jgi:hypothetical protein
MDAKRFVQPASHENFRLPTGNGPGTIVNLRSAASQPGCPRLKVLVLDEEIPYPLDSGKRIRTFNLLERLARRHSITLLCYGESRRSWAGRAGKAGIRVELVEPLAERTRRAAVFAAVRKSVFALPILGGETLHPAIPEGV